MKYAILFVIAFILLSIAIDVGAMRNAISPEKTTIEKVVENIVKATKEK